MQNICEFEDLENSCRFKHGQHLQKRHLLKFGVEIENVHGGHRYKVRPRVGALEEEHFIWRKDEPQADVHCEPYGGDEVDNVQCSVAGGLDIEVIQCSQGELDDVCGEGDERNDTNKLPRSNRIKST